MINQDDLIQETIDFEGRYHEEMYITVAECKQIMKALEQRLVKNLAIPVVSLPKGTFVPCEVKLPKEPRPVDMNTKYRRDKLLGTNES